MDRELLLEIGCEELPAGWLPGLTNQIGESSTRAAARASAAAGVAGRNATARRGGSRSASSRIPERQTDLEELRQRAAGVGGFKPRRHADAGRGRVRGEARRRRRGARARRRRPRASTSRSGKRQRGKATVDVLPDVLARSLRGLTFPKSMHWDAMLEDGKGDLLFGRPIRWMLYLYGGRVVPFTIARTPAAQTAQVQDVTTGAVTYGHRFLTTSGRAGRAIKVALVRRVPRAAARELRHPRARRAPQQDRARARRQGAAAAGTGQPHRPRRVRAAATKCRTSSSIRRSSPARSRREFLELPEEVLTTTLIHHQHYFPVEGEDGKLKNAFLAVINTEPDNERTIARNAERVVTARLRDARFFWEADRKTPLEARIDRLGTLLFHKKLGTYKEKAERIETLARVDCARGARRRRRERRRWRRRPRGWRRPI